MPNGRLHLGKPLLYQFARWITFGSIPDTHFVNMHPMVFAAWFGMLATALNLLPFGQLDGGHITYATLGRARRRSRCDGRVAPCDDASSRSAGC